MCSLSDEMDYARVSSTLSITSVTGQKTQTCAAVSAVDDRVLEGNEDFSVNLLSLGEGNVTVIQGAETLNVVIEDDEGVATH